MDDRTTPLETRPTAPTLPDPPCVGAGVDGWAPAMHFAVVCAVGPVVLALLLLMVAAVSTSQIVDGMVGMVGFWLLGGGALFNLLGVAIVVASWFFRPHPRGERPPGHISSLPVLVLLLAAWPIAWACVAVGMRAIGFDPATSTD